MAQPRIETIVPAAGVEGGSRERGVGSSRGRSYEAEIGLMHEGGRLEGVVFTLAGHVRTREPSQLGFDERHELVEITKRHNGLVDAIADGLRTPGLKARLEELERRRAALEAELATAPPRVPRSTAAGATATLTASGAILFQLIPDRIELLLPVHPSSDFFLALRPRLRFLGPDEPYRLGAGQVSFRVDLTRTARQPGVDVRLEAATAPTPDHGGALAGAERRLDLLLVVVVLVERRGDLAVRVRRVEAVDGRLAVRLTGRTGQRPVAGGATAAGCTSTNISRRACLIMISARNSLMPPPVEPVLGITQLRNSIHIAANTGHSE